MTFGSLFSGVGGADLGLVASGMTGLWTCEFDRQCQDVLRFHHPETPNYPDVRTFPAQDCPVSDVLWMSPPCQDLSVAGLRRGLAGDRSGLFHDAIRAASHLVRRGTRYILMEQVPGLLSSNGGDDLRLVLRAFRDLGAMDVAWRVLDSQWFGVPQRRRRLFLAVDLVGFRAGAILALAQGLRGDSAPRRETGQSVTGALTIGSSGSSYNGQDAYTGHLIPEHAWTGQFIPEVTHTLRADGFDASEDGTGRGTPLVSSIAIETGQGFWTESDVAGTLRSHTGGSTHATICAEVSGTLMASGAGVERPAGMPAEADYLVFDTTQMTSAANRSNPKAGDPCHPLAAGAHAPEIAFNSKWSSTSGARFDSDVSPSIDVCKGDGLSVAYGIQMRERGDDGRGYPRPHLIDTDLVGALDTIKPHAVAGPTTRVRRLMPIECERLQGWPDDHTRYGRKADGTVVEMADGPRYRMCGNGVTASVAEWIGRNLMESPDV